MRCRTCMLKSWEVCIRQIKVQCRAIPIRGWPKVHLIPCRLCRSTLGGNRVLILRKLLIQYFSRISMFQCRLAPRMRLSRWLATIFSQEPWGIMLGATMDNCSISTSRSTSILSRAYSGRLNSHTSEKWIQSAERFYCRAAMGIISTSSNKSAYVHHSIAVVDCLTA